MRTLGLVGLGIVVILLIALLVGPLFVPVPPLTGTVEAATLVDADSRFVDLPLGSDTLSVHYKEAGDPGRSLVLLHGFGASLFSWREVMAPLAATNQVIAFDRPAFGLTERPLRETWGTVSDWAAGIPYSAEAQADLTDCPARRAWDRQGRARRATRPAARLRCWWRSNIPSVSRPWC